MTVGRATRTAVFGLLLAVATAAFGQPEKVDRIVVVVGKDVILASELAEQIQMAVFQSGKRPQSPEEIKVLRDQVLEQMVSDRLFLIEAKKDTSITVRAEEIDQALEEQVSRVASQFGSESEFQAALAKENLTLRDLKKKYRPDIENKLLKQRLIQRKLMAVSVSRHEVEEFFQKYQDSIPNQPEALRLSHLQLTIQPSARVEDSVKQLATQLRQQIAAGADFASVSEKYSSMNAGSNGGDLGFLGPDDVVPEFAKVAFSLNVGDISSVVRTPFGYHIIKCEGKEAGRYHLRHVLLAVPPSQADSAVTMRLADSLLTAARAGADFAELVKTFSTDNNNRANGGDLGWFSTAQIPPDFAEAVKDWKTPGEYRGPVISRIGIHILKLADYQPEKKLNITDDFDKIKELARQDKTGKMVDKWIAQLKDKTYVEYRLEE